LVNKIDLLPHVDVDLDTLLANLQVVHPGMEHLLASARTGEGVEAFGDWLLKSCEGARGGVMTTPTQGPCRSEEVKLA
jgi:hydrogenase nickel incorporation protein HypB